MLKQNPNLSQDCDNERKTPLHWAAHLDQTNMCQILIDFGANMFAKDDYSKKPLDEAISTSQVKSGQINKGIARFYELAAAGSLKRDITKYEQPLYVKYLTPVEQVKELADFIKRVNDMSTLKSHKKQTDRDDDDEDSSDEDVEEQVHKVNIGNQMNTGNQWH